MNGTILKIFPTPVYVNTLSQELSEEEKNFYKTLTYRENFSNLISTDMHILNNVCMKRIKEELQKVILDYTEKVIQPKNEIEIFITESWINLTSPGESHHMHDHPNSFISGVLYLDVLEGEDELNFHKKNMGMLEIESSAMPEWNVGCLRLFVKNNDIVIFPSNLPHNTPKVLSNKQRTPRISLSFNTFVRGQINCIEASSLTL